MEKIEFMASLKSTGKAVQFDNEGAGQITLITDAGELAQAVRMLTLTQSLFRVTIEKEEHGEDIYNS